MLHFPPRISRGAFLLRTHGWTGSSTAIGAPFSLRGCSTMRHPGAGEPGGGVSPGGYTWRQAFPRRIHRLCPFGAKTASGTIVDMNHSVRAVTGGPSNPNGEESWCRKKHWFSAKDTVVTLLRPTTGTWEAGRIGRRGPVTRVPVHVTVFFRACWIHSSRT